jgi:hypothetical protein
VTGGHLGPGGKRARENMSIDVGGYIEVRTPGASVWKALEGIDIDRDNGMLRCLFGGASGYIFPPIAPGRTVPPPDASPEVLSRFRHSGSPTDEENSIQGWITWAEIMAIDWEKPEVVGYNGYIRTKRGELVPSLGHTDRPDRERREEVRRQQERLQEVLNQLGGWPEEAEDLEVDGVIYRRVLRSRSEVMSEDWQLLFERMKKLATQYKPEGVRLVVWLVV